MSGHRRNYQIDVIGDSIGQTSHYPQHLGEALRANGVNAQILDHTIPGRTSSYAVTAAQEIASRKIKPDLVILELGGNDLIQKIDPRTTRQNLETAIQTLQSAGVKVMIAGMQAPAYTPPGYRPGYREDFNAIVPDLARKYHIVADPLFIQPVIANPNGQSPSQIFNHSSMNSDMIHPNDYGGTQIANRMAAFVERALQIPNAPPLPAPALTR